MTCFLLRSINLWLLWHSKEWIGNEGVLQKPLSLVSTLPMREYSFPFKFQMVVERLRQLLKARPEMIKKFAMALFILSILLLGCFCAQLSQLEGLNGAIDPATLLEVQRLDKLKELNVNKKRFLFDLYFYSSSLLYIFKHFSRKILEPEACWDWDVLRRISWASIIMFSSQHLPKSSLKTFLCMAVH